MPAPGLNYRLSDILCAVGIPQLRRLDELLAARARLAAAYAERLASLPVLLPHADDGDVHGWQAYVVQVDRRDEVLAELRAAGDRGADRHVRAAPARRLPRPGGFSRRRRPSSGRSRCRSIPGSTSVIAPPGNHLIFLTRSPARP